MSRSADDEPPLLCARPHHSSTVVGRGPLRAHFPARRHVMQGSRSPHFTWALFYEEPAVVSNAAMTFVIPWRSGLQSFHNFLSLSDNRPGRADTHDSRPPPLGRPSARHFGGVAAPRPGERVFGVELVVL
ncbi:hypothetical protein B0H14DRAFT_3482708 [Mycena olivaceomarginata]|nr:hypothetical protein B0H14DRAFT_3482708 [Mycena olivaceomarginata]